MPKIKSKMTWKQLHNYVLEIIEISKGSVDHYGRYMELLVKFAKEMGQKIIEETDAKDKCRHND